MESLGPNANRVGMRDRELERGGDGGSDEKDMGFCFCFSGECKTCAISESSRGEASQY